MTAESTTKLRVEDLRIRFGSTEVVHGVDARVDGGGILGLIGESGSGKTTIGRAIAGFHPASGGRILLNGQALPARRPRAERRRIQLVFQDPALSLNPGLRVEEMLLELLRAGEGRTDTARERERRYRELLDMVALTPELAKRRPSHLSGGQRQRAAIARALATGPEVLIADEPTSALDVAVQAEILTLFASLATDRGLAIVLISHDLRVVERLTSEIVVLRDGRVEESGSTADVLRDPKSEYTRELLAAVPQLDARRGEAPGGAD